MEVMPEKDTVLSGGHGATTSSFGKVSPKEFSISEAKRTLIGIKRVGDDERVLQVAAVMTFVLFV